MEVEKNNSSEQTIPTESISPDPPSQFDGTTLQLIGWRFVGLLLTLVTLGIAFPWVHCMIYRWEAKHTIIGGKRLHFDGTGIQLLGKYLLWGLLIVVTLGIYTIFLPVQIQKWRVSHTRFATKTETLYGEPVSGWAIAAGILGGVLSLVLISGGLYLLLAFFGPKDAVGEPLPTETINIEETCEWKSTDDIEGYLTAILL